LCKVRYLKKSTEKGEYMTSQESTTGNKSRETVWRIGPRILPPPTGGSAELRDAIASIPQPDPATMKIEPQSEEEWLAVIAQLDAGKVEANKALREQLSVSVTQEEIVGINVYHLACMAAPSCSTLAKRV
jgi:hypothetical protein